jgi:hypothetical protein
VASGWMLKNVTARFFGSLWWDVRPIPEKTNVREINFLWMISWENK